MAASEMVPVAALAGGDQVTIDRLDATLRRSGIEYRTEGSVWWSLLVARGDADRARALIEADPILREVLWR